MSEIMKKLTKTSLNESRALHDSSVEAVIRFLEKRGLKPRRISLEAHIFGDIEFTSDTGTKKRILVRSEEGNRYGNFFFETFRNKGIGELGWASSGVCLADLLGYHFLADGKLFVMDFSLLKTWLKDNQNRFKELEQKKRLQENETWGRVVPINLASKELRIYEYSGVF